MTGTQDHNHVWGWRITHRGLVLLSVDSPSTVSETLTRLKELLEVSGSDAMEEIAHLPNPYR